jgi:dolichyl-phosphate beta-glucosyltransferase
LPELSVILPCYRAAPIAASSVKQLHEALAAGFTSWEIIVVDDGGHDVSDALSRLSDKVRIVRLATNRGKGAAVRAGMLAATGDVRVYTDVDLPYGTAIISAMTRYIAERGFHAVIGDRTLPSAVYREQLTWGRRTASYIFSAVVGRIVTGGFFDTQCGLKAFRGDVAQLLFSMLRIDRFAFDVEVVYVCLKHRLDIKRIPVHLQNNVTSSVRLIRDSLRGMVDIFRIKFYQLTGHYRSADLERVVRADYTEFTRQGSATGAVNTPTS